MNCGPDNTPLAGSWEHLQLPVESWVAWCWLNDHLEAVTTWEQVDNVLAILVLHPGKYATWMWYVDRYPPPPGTEGPLKDGLQIGDVDGLEWQIVRDQIKVEAKEWRRHTT